MHAGRIAAISLVEMDVETGLGQVCLAKLCPCPGTALPLCDQAKSRIAARLADSSLFIT